MLEGDERRQALVSRLKASNLAISASKFAEEFGVSRQVIVGDVALLRAAGEEIIATARGYKLEKVTQEAGYVAKIAVQHGKELTQEELEIILSFDAEVIDVVVEHELYGELVGSLHIRSQEDIQRFMEKYQKSNANLLSQLTNGIHLHTIRYQRGTDLEKIKAALAEKGILYQG